MYTHANKNLINLPTIDLEWRMSANDLLSSALFDGGDESAWLELVSKALKGGTPEKLARCLCDDVAINPLYKNLNNLAPSEDRETSCEPLVKSETNNVHLPWDIRQTFSNPSPEITNSEILRDLERGVSSVEIKLANKYTSGVHIRTLDDLEATLKGVDASIATVALDHQGILGKEVSTLLSLWAEKQDKSSDIKLAFNIDPTQLNLNSQNLKNAFQTVANFVNRVSERFPASLVLRSDSRYIHEAGGSEVQELGVLIASAIETTRFLDELGIPPSTTANSMQFTLAVSANYGVECAKIRAARLLWVKCLNTLKVPESKIAIQGVTSNSMLTKYDPWTNIIRNTCACFGAITGGCDSISVEYFTNALGIASELGRRVARNTQIIAMEESNLGKVSDPISGAWFVEELTNDLAEKAWEEFQRIEGEGGLINSKRNNLLQSRVRDVCEHRKQSIAKKEKLIVGVNAFPSSTEVAPPIADQAESPLEPLISDNGTEEPNQENGTRNPLTVSHFILEKQSLSSDFERCRKRVEDHIKRTGKHPKIFIVTFGTQAEYNLRLDFTRNYFATVGIDIIESDGKLSRDQIVQNWMKSGCKIVCLAGSDIHYQADAEDTVNILKRSGARFVYLSGKFSCDGVDQNIFIGQNVIDVLELTLSRLGIE